jgi:GT2 family glycosyltransferase
MMIEISVVVPCYRSKGTIRDCLNAIMAQSLPRDSYEVIVVDSSDDGTDELIQKDFPSVHLIHLPQKTLPGEARNLGVKQSQAPLIAFIDSDCVPDKDLLKGMVQGMTDDHYAGIGGSVLNGTRESLAGWVEYILSFKEFSPKHPKHPTGHSPTCNLCLRREVFEKYGPFPTDFFPGEDSVFNWRLSSAGETYLFDPALQVSHLHRTDFWRVFQHQYRYGQAFAITRSRFSMPGRIFVVFPLLSLFIPFVRWGSILVKLRWNLRLLALSVLLSPFLFSALVVWAFGFWRQLQEEEESQSRNLK